MSERPIITVGLVVRNMVGTIHQSILSLELQTLTDWELVVIDDNSTDGTTDFLRSLVDRRIRTVFRSRRSGLASGLNEAIRLARGKYFARMDADDIAYPRRFERQFGMMEADSTVDLVGSSAVLFDSTGQAVGQRTVPEGHHDICRSPHAGIRMMHPTYFGRTAWFRKYWYTEAMGRAQDQDLLLRSWQSSQFANSPEILLGYRLGQTSLSKSVRSRAALLSAMFRSRNVPRARAASAVGSHLAVLMIEMVAAMSGLTPLLSRLRASSIDAAARAEWRSVWKSVS